MIKNPALSLLHPVGNNLTVPLDIQTLLVAVALATAFCAAARLLLWRMHLSIPGLGRWALAGSAAVITLVLILFYGKFQWRPSLSFAQAFVVMGLLLSWDGFRRFIGKPALTPVVLGGISAIGLAWILIAQTEYLIDDRGVGNAFLMAVLSFLIAYDLLRSPQGNMPAIRATGAIYAINTVVFLIRAVIAQGSPEIIDPLNPNGVAAFMLLWLLCSMIAITLGMVLMTAERLQADLNNQANHDPLTGALNRRSFALLYEKAMAYSRRNQRPLSVLMIDLDNFKYVNDHLGHEFGDKVLCSFVAVTQKTLREEDVFCRFGGEEFVALLPNTGSESALGVANRLRSAFEIDSALIEPKAGHEPLTITVSIGIVELKLEEGFEALLSRADNALYQAKDNGRNRCEVAG